MLAMLKYRCPSKFPCMPWPVLHSIFPDLRRKRENTSLKATTTLTLEYIEMDNTGVRTFQLLYFFLRQTFSNIAISLSLSLSLSLVASHILFKIVFYLLPYSHIIIIESPGRNTLFLEQGPYVVGTVVGIFFLMMYQKISTCRPDRYFCW